MHVFIISETTVLTICCVSLGLGLFRLFKICTNSSGRLCHSILKFSTQFGTNAAELEAGDPIADDAGDRGQSG